MVDECYHRCFMLAWEHSSRSEDAAGDIRLVLGLYLLLMQRRKTPRWTSVGIGVSGRSGCSPGSISRSSTNVS